MMTYDDIEAEVKDQRRQDKYIDFYLSMVWRCRYIHRGLG